VDRQSFVLLIVVVILAVSNVFVYVTLENQITTLNANYEDYVANHHHTDTEFSSLQSLNNDLEDIVNLNEERIYLNHEIVNQPANYYTYWIFHDVEYAGYFTITIHSSTTTKAYVKVVYIYGGTQWVLERTLGVSGSAVFPVLPSPTAVEIGIGNTNFFDSASHDFTVVYCY
jgi:hypothetical protein